MCGVFWLFSCYFLRYGLSLDKGYQYGSTVYETNLRFLLAPTCLEVGLQILPFMPGFTWLLEIQAQVLTSL